MSDIPNVTQNGDILKDMSNKFNSSDDTLRKFENSSNIN